MFKQTMTSCGSLLAIFMIGCEQQANQPPAQTPDSTSVETAPAASLALADEIIVEDPFGNRDYHFVLVPGDEAKGIAPFYMATTEVTWDQFTPWYRMDDITDPIDRVDAQVARLRPSHPGNYIAVLNHDDQSRPAFGMTWFTAKIYAEWLAFQSNHNIQLPTETQWEQALIAGGDALETMPDNINDVAWHLNNSYSTHYLDDYFGEIGTKSPNAIGIYDLLGNAAEWAQVDGEQYVLRGGHYLTKPEDMTGQWRVEEDPDGWNRYSDVSHNSRWWYFGDSNQMGIRLVLIPEGDQS